MKNLLKNKKYVMMLGIAGIFLLIGVSYAIWQMNFVQTDPNILSTACFSVTYTEQDNISLLNTYPMLDSEGRTLTPYQFTIKNNCEEYGAYQVNLEVLNTTTLDGNLVKVMFNEDTPQLLTAYTPVTKTLDNATTAYKMAAGFLHQNEEITYTLRLWVDEHVTLEDHVEGQRFASKITIVNTYKESITPLEECEATYGEGASICSIIGQADPDNDKCLQVDANGKIIEPNSNRLSDSDTPIICAMEDDYGTSYYLRGLHTNNNVKFANSCWKIIRVTGSGGIKMIYNGDIDGNGKCTTTSGNHSGFAWQTLSLSGNKKYGTSYTKSGSTYTLTNVSTMNWSTDSASIIGKYTCGNTSTSCANPYYVVSSENATTAYVLRMGVSTNYAQIGNSKFNPNMNSPSYEGYMYNDVYTTVSSGKTTSYGTTILSSQSASSSNYYYGDTLSYSEGYYYITNQDGSNVSQLSWASNYQNNLVGKYTCKSTSKYNDTTLRCETAYKVLDTTTKANYMIAESLSGGRLAIGTIKLSQGYTDNQNGTYTLNNVVREISAMDWYNGYSTYRNYYVCEDFNQTTCNRLYKIPDPSQTRIGTVIGVFNNYFYGSSFTYTEGAERPYTLTDTVQFWDISDSTNQTKLNTHHYTCFNAVDNTCQELNFIYYYLASNVDIITVNGNETGPQALNKMVNNNDINVKDSAIKKFIDGWYAMNFKNTEYESYLEDTIFCNDRTIALFNNQENGWSETGDVTNYLYFNGTLKNFYLKCPNKRDAFTVSDATKGNSALTYPVGLLTITEHALTGNYTTNKTGVSYWSFSPEYFFGKNATEKYVDNNGNWTYGGMQVDSAPGVRPVISLKPGTQFVAGTDGTAANPYEVE